MSIAANLEKIEEKIAQALQKSQGSRNDIQILGVTKKQGLERIRQAHGLGLRHFGENYLQEFHEKQKALSDLEIYWHFIGRIQSKKAKYLDESFCLVHSVDSSSVIQKLPARTKILLQVNLAGEASKGGISPEEGPRWLEEVQSRGDLLLCGLMTMPPLSEDADRARPYFARLKELATNWQRELSGSHHLKELSMGTSGDYDVAIEEGATIVRLGTCLFGPRPS